MFLKKKKKKKKKKDAQRGRSWSKLKKISNLNLLSLLFLNHMCIIKNKVKGNYLSSIFICEIC